MEAIGGARLRQRTWAVVAALLAAFALMAAPQWASAGSGAAGSNAVAPQEYPEPTGWQSLERLDLLPYVRPGATTFQASSVDPIGDNDDGLSGRYSCRHRVAQGCLMAAHHGPGELEAVWSAGNQVGSTAASGRLMIELDGRVVVDDTWPHILAGKLGNPFIFPLTLAAYQSFGGVSINVPMPFRREMRVISEFNPHYFHVIYRAFPSARGVKTFSRGDRVPGRVRTELGQAGQHNPVPPAARTRSSRHSFRLAAGRRLVLARIEGSGAIGELRLKVSHYTSARPTGAIDQARDLFAHARLQISFDGMRSVDAPIGEFFGSGLGPAPVHALMFAMDGAPDGWASTWWPMPFASRARVELVNTSHTGIARGELDASWTTDARWGQRLGAQGDAGYFHAHGHGSATRRGSDWQLLDTRGIGKFVGVTMTLEGGSPPYYMEGNERAYVDGAKIPQIQGTGTEDFFGGGWYFFDQLFSLPLTGYTAHESAASGCPEPTCKSAYRIMVADAVPFSRSLRYEIQHGARDQSPAFYSSTAYWYQRPVNAPRTR
jgi:D-arabinan exo alpha-(1,3)/(1,5)-arabinofuranosidase (non-reducing end)